jgi:hypothetical protein
MGAARCLKSPRRIESGEATAVRSDLILIAVMIPAVSGDQLVRDIRIRAWPPF